MKCSVRSCLELSNMMHLAVITFMAKQNPPSDFQIYNTMQRWPAPRSQLHSWSGRYLGWSEIVEGWLENVRQISRTVIFLSSFVSFTRKTECHQLIQKFVCEGAEDTWVGAESERSGPSLCLSSISRFTCKCISKWRIVFCDGSKGTKFSPEP